MSKQWIVVGEHIIPAEHADRRIAFSTDRKEDKEEFAHLICIVRGKYQNDKANARLIAAAPDLLIAAKMALSVMRLLDFHTDPTAERLERAIEAATGEPA